MPAGKKYGGESNKSYAQRKKKKGAARKVANKKASKRYGK